MRARRLAPHVVRDVTATLPRSARADMAVPSYGHWNPLIRWLFWARLDAALRLALVRPGEAVVDFASGTGVLLPSIAALGATVIATDLRPQPTRTLIGQLGLAVHSMDLESFAAWAPLHPASVDCIFALDVLDHVGSGDLLAWSSLFAALLRTNGRLIVSGATETTWHKLGRAVAGFRNEYHQRSVFDVDAALRQRWARDRMLFLPPRPLPPAFMLARYRGGHAD